MKKISLAIMSLVLSLLFILSACPGFASSDTGKLVLYTAASDAQLELIVPHFEALTGIEVELITGGVGELMKRLEAESGSPMCDVLFGGTRTSNLSSASLFEDYRSAEFENQLENCRHEEGHVVTYAQTALCMIVNDNLIGDIQLNGFEDLLNPELKGKIAFADPSASSNAFTLLVNMLYAMGNGDIWSDAAWDYVAQLCSQLDNKVLSSSSATPRGVADGEYTVGLTHEVYVGSYIGEGAPVRAVYFSEGTFVSEEVVSIIANAPNMKSAQLFIDFMLSADMQERYKDESNARPARIGIDAPSGMLSTNEINIVPEVIVTDEEKAEILERFSDALYS